MGVRVSIYTGAERCAIRSSRCVNETKLVCMSKGRSPLRIGADNRRPVVELRPVGLRSSCTRSKGRGGALSTPTRRPAGAT